MKDSDLEKRLAALSLARASDDYLEKGLSLVHAGSVPAGGFRQRRLSWVLASALVLSVSANVFQLVSNHQADTTAGRLMAQCNTPAAAASPVHDSGVEFATLRGELQPLGMC